MRKIAVVYSGCGNKDGTEITEAVSLIIALSEAGVQVHSFAPNVEAEAKNFLTGDSMGHRNLMTEAARITRSEISDLENLKSDDFDGLVFPGGYGAALNLCNWAQAGAACKVIPKIEQLIREFHKQSKPIGAVCIAPVLIAKVLGNEGIELTLGNNPEVIKEVQKTGAQHVVCPVDDYVTDRHHKIVTTPAYMYDNARPHELFRGISGLVNELVEMA